MSTPHVHVEFIYPVRCRYVPNKRVAEVGDRAHIPAHEAEVIQRFIKVLNGGDNVDVVVGDEPVAPAPEDDLVNLNTASKDELKALKHIGAVTAQKLIDARPIETLDDAFAASELRGDQWAELLDQITI